MESNLPLFIAREIAEIEAVESYLNKETILINILITKEIRENILNRN